MDPVRTKKTADGRTYRYRRSEAAMEKEALAKKAWRNENYERLTVDVPKGMLQQLKEAAERRGVSRRALIIELLKKGLYE